MKKASLMATTNNIEHVIPECEVMYFEDEKQSRTRNFFENGDMTNTLFEKCDKDPGHSGYVDAAKFSRDHLPHDIRTDEILDLVNSYIDRTVHIVVKRTSSQRPDHYPYGNVPYPYSELKGTSAVRCGTGVIVLRSYYDLTLRPFEYIEGKPCPCCECKTNNTGLHPPRERDHAIVVVTTATHVIFDDYEAEGAEIMFGYNSEENKSDVKYLFGLGLHYVSQENSEKVAKSQTDKIRFKCVTHDPELIRILKGMEPIMYNVTYPPMGLTGVMVSHPHGRCKKVSFGCILSKAFPQYSKDYQNQQNLPCFLSKRGTRGRMSFENSTDFSRKYFRQLIRDNNTNGDFDDETKQMKYFQKTIALFENGLSISVPKDAPFFCQRRGLYERWVWFPPKTKFSWIENEWHLLPGLEVELLELEKNKLHFPVLWFHRGWLTYDINTCPGCSGAAILYSERGPSCVYHSGALPDGPNRSTVLIS